MNAPAVDEIRRIERVVTAFLDEWTVRTKRRYSVGDSLVTLRRITAASEESYRALSGRLIDLAEWLDQYGDAVVGDGVRREDLEVLVTATEELVSLRARHENTASPAEAEKLAVLLERLVGLIRRGTSTLGLEYTPAGLVDAAGPQKLESQRTRRSLLERLQGFEDVKAAYRKALEFQMERLSYFYQEDTHLLTVLDYQLKNLEARPNPEDEFFAASLLYFLRQHNYQVTPYLKRFQKVVTQEPSSELWGER